MPPIPFRRLSALALVAVAITSAGAEAQAPLQHGATMTTRVAMVRDATVCSCVTNGEPAPRIRDLVIVAIGRRHRLATSASGAWTLDYVPEFLPLLYSNGTADGRLEVWRCGATQYCGQSDEMDVWSMRSVGVGALPIAAVVSWLPSDLLQLRARISGGAVLLSRPIPLAQGTNFNFVAEGGASVGVRASRRLVLTGGVVLNHISNGGLADVNLGMDSRMLELGAVISR